MIDLPVIILAAGQSSRFYPFNQTHKSLYRLLGQSILAHTVHDLVKAHLKNLIVVHAPHVDVESELHSFRKLAQIKFIPQPKPLGQADAILRAREFIDSRCLVINAQQINTSTHLNDFSQFIETHPDTDDQVILFSQTTSTPEKYGMLGLDGHRVTKIVEKPAQLTGLSNQRIVGIYHLTKAFLDFMSTTLIEEYQLERDLQTYLQDNPVYTHQTPHPTVSLKYPWDLFPLSQILLKAQPKKIHSTAFIHPTAIIGKDVYLGPKVKIYEYSIIDGPCYIGADCIIGRYTEIGPYTILESQVELQRRCEIKRSLVGEGSHLHSAVILDSILGQDTRIGANFITANRRLDRRDIFVQVKGQRVNTHRNSLGAFIGSRTKIGIHSGTNPGSIIPPQSTVLPGGLFHAQT